MAARIVNRKKATGLSNDEWAAKFPKVESWLKRRRRSRKPMLSILRIWHEWMMENGGELAGKSPEELLEFQRRARKSDDDGEEYLILDKIDEFLHEHEDWRIGYQRKVLSTVRSFFKVNRAPLPEASEITRNLRSNVAPVRKNLTVKHLKRIVDGKSRLYRAIFMSMLAGGMGMDEVIEWSDQGIAELRKALRDIRFSPDGKRAIRIDLKPRKGSHQPSYTFVGGDALEEVEKWLNHRDRLKIRFERLHPSEAYPEAVFITAHNTPLNVNTIRTYWRRRIYALGLMEKEAQPRAGTRYGLNTHQIRSLFRTLFGRSHSETRELHAKAAEFMMGHTVDRLRYDQFFRDESLVLNEYWKALPYFNILSSDIALGKIDALAISAQEKRIKEQQKKIEQLEKNVNSLLEGRERMGKLLEEARQRAVNAEQQFWDLLKRPGVFDALVELTEEHMKRSDKKQKEEATPEP